MFCNNNHIAFQNEPFLQTLWTRARFRHGVTEDTFRSKIMFRHSSTELKVRNKVRFRHR